MPLNKQVEIVAMGLADISAVMEIEQQSHSHPWSQKLFISNFGKRYFNHLLLVDGKIQGYFVASSVAGEVTLMNIAINPEQQGLGFGVLLLQYLIDYTINNDEQEIWLEVRGSNQVAIKLYQKLGFVEVDKRKDYYPTESGREDAIIMCKYL